LPHLDDVHKFERRRPYEQPGIGRRFPRATRGQQCLPVFVAGESGEGAVDARTEPVREPHSCRRLPVDYGLAAAEEQLCSGLVIDLEFKRG
jgi:hypothetical protein